MGTDPALCYDFSTFFGSDELSDLTLVLTAGAEEQQPPPAKKARGKKKATAAPVLANEYQQQLPGHAMVLAGCSPVFKVSSACLCTRCPPAAQLAMHLGESTPGRSWIRIVPASVTS